MTSRQTLSPVDYAALAFATWGVGFLPLAPGTWGSLVGIGVFFALGSLVLQVVGVIVVTGLGIWAATRTETILGAKDPGKVVVDEVAGQMIALLPLTVFGLARGWIIVSFILFRAFDIFKPYPARRFEALRAGLGIMADDLVAGVYAALIIIVVRII
ncbi:MAG TPA: phosphatidylglycerophosphatase A [Pyrinomonadaceae bacterium]